MDRIVKVIIPAFNEQNGVGNVVRDIPKGLVSEIIVVNNASTDETEYVAREAGATVLKEETKGYGRACLKGINYVTNSVDKADVIVFIDADYSDYPEEMEKLVAPVITNGMDLVIGSRALGNLEKGSMTPQQVFGNWLATRLIRLFYNVKFTDLGPFRAIKYDKLIELGMVDTTYGWTVEMQVKAAKKKFNCMEVPVTYRRRIGFSKISGTIKGTVMAGYKILWTIFKHL